MPRWYERLVQDCKEILARMREDNLRRMHELGTRVLRDEPRLLRWNARGNGEKIKRLAKDIGVGVSTVYRVIRFARKYPDIENFISTYKVQLGDKLSWTYVVDNLLYNRREAQPPIPYLIKRRFRRSLRRRQIVERIVVHHKLNEDQVRLLLERIPKGKMRDFEGVVNGLALEITKSVKAPTLNIKADFLAERVRELFELWREKWGAGMITDGGFFMEFDRDYFFYEIVMKGVLFLEEKVYKPYPPCSLSLPRG